MIGGRVMKTLFHRPAPKAVLAAVTLEPHEKVVCWGRGPGTTPDSSTYVVATDKALYLDGRFGNRRLPWSSINKANWDEPMLELVVQTSPGGTAEAISIRLDEPGHMPTTVRERVTATIVVQERVLLEGDKGALMVARKNFDDDQVRWSVVLDKGLDSTNPVIRQRADDMLAELRTQFGI